MPIENFLDEFMPSSSSFDKGMPSPHRAFSSIPNEESIRNEKDIYDPFVSISLITNGLAHNSTASVSGLQSEKKMPKLHNRNHSRPL